MAGFNSGSLINLMMKDPQFMKAGGKNLRRNNNGNNQRQRDHRFKREEESSCSEEIKEPEIQIPSRQPDHQRQPSQNCQFRVSLQHSEIVYSQQSATPKNANSSGTNL